MTNEEVLEKLQDKVRINDFGPLGRIARLGCVIQINATDIGAQHPDCNAGLIRQCLDRAFVILNAEEGEFVLDANGFRHQAEFVQFDLKRTADL